MPKTAKRKAGKKPAIDPDFLSIAEAKRRARNVDRSYKELGRMIQSLTARRARLEVQLRQFANATIEWLDREPKEPFNPPAAEF